MKNVGVWGAVNPTHNFQHAGSLEVKMHYKPNSASFYIYISRGSDLDIKDENVCFSFLLSDFFIEWFFQFERWW